MQRSSVKESSAYTVVKITSKDSNPSSLKLAKSKMVSKISSTYLQERMEKVWTLISVIQVSVHSK